MTPTLAGLFTVPLAVLLTWLLIRHAPQRRDRIGLLAGPGGLGLTSGVANGNQGFIVAGSVLMVAAVGLYLVAAKRDRRE